jgi:ribosomal protein S18 acetylase RimI-like enzyme
MSFHIVPAQESDADIIIDFNQQMAVETEDRRLPDDVIGPGVRSILSDVQKGLYLLAKDDQGKIVGQLMVTYEWSDWRNGTFWWIQSVYVAPAARRQGIYRRLHEEVRKLARATGQACGIRLYVEKENLGAQKTYEDIGMKHSHYLMYEEDWAED